MKTRAGGSGLTQTCPWRVLLASVMWALAACAPQGALRTEVAPADAPFTAEDLARNFEQIVFRYEFRFDDAGRKIDEPLAKPLKRWKGVIRYRLVGDAATAEDARTIADLLQRIAPLTGLRFVEVPGGEDMLISIASPEGQDRVAALLEARGRSAHRKRYETWRRDRHWVCGATLSSSREDRDRLVEAHIFLRSDTTGVGRQACLHEEIVQALGLTNDSDSARPSIFNDDQEFALMTLHDELLLRALYDPALRPGMNAAEAMPKARALFADYLAARARGGVNP